jgi:hypothetical protein
MDQVSIAGRRTTPLQAQPVLPGASYVNLACRSPLDMLHRKSIASDSVDIIQNNDFMSLNRSKLTSEYIENGINKNGARRASAGAALPARHSAGNLPTELHVRFL